MSTRVPALTVVIPVYRSAKILPDLLPRLLPALEQLADEHEVIFVDDHSPDESWEVIGRLAAEHPSVRGIHLMRNFGQHNALLCGIREARHDLVVTMDDDLQHPPEEIHKLLERTRNPYLRELALYYLDTHAHALVAGGGEQAGRQAQQPARRVDRQRRDGAALP